MTDPAASPIANAPALILGGGIAGLASALAFARQGIASHILEKRANYSEEGAGIQIGPNGTRILQQLGVAERLQPLVGTPEALSVRDGRSGAQLALLPLGDWIAQRHGAPYWTAHRRDLHSALLAAAEAEPRITITLGDTAASITSDDAGVSVATTAGRSASGFALIAADGIGSTVRTSLFDAAQPTPYGKSAARSVIPIAAAPEQLRRQIVTIWLLPDAHVVHYPVSGGQELAMVVVLDDTHLSDSWNEPVPVGEIEQALSASAPALRKLIMQTHDWKRWTLRTLPVPAQLAIGNVALAGDAAHPMLPFFAQGGVMALEDAAVLAATLGSKQKTTGGLLADYASKRRARVARVVAASQRNGRIYHLDGAVALARNAVLRIAPPQHLMRQYDWLYGWRAT
ncbi:FAD-dependent monooxygenase [Hyphomicrobium sulfonivorans]|uniref:FAD-dependent monooxygenase n=1 Tax=Hyphomicrobium sulfonivorans TaxID=121290 RepID=UPI00156E39A0|nr:FAD-dependent monooxygenase [Hyphomicrobium sulfonivorans]MBI1648944.1 FAD-dependent monooxygenase [Hyphomicrobium sulfonivorans]NSL70521.1 FAD-binding monooxygenase [Hyphomicrobium sulfonivorans]